MPEIVRETRGDISDADMAEAISQIDFSNPSIGARIFATAFGYGSESSSSNTYHCRGMGRAGDGILKSTPGPWRKKGGLTSSQVAELHSQMQAREAQMEARFQGQQSQLQSQLQRMADENTRLRQHQHELAAWQQAVADVQAQNNDIFAQWTEDMYMAQAQGLPPPPRPVRIPLPERPRTPPREDPQQQHEGQDQQQQDGDDLRYDLDFDE